MKSADSELRIIAETLNKTVRIMVCFAAVSWFVTLLLFVAAFSNTERQADWLFYGCVMSLFSASVTGYFVFRNRPESFPFYRILQDQPRTIVWYYIGSTENRFSGINIKTNYWIAIRTIDRKFAQLYCTEREILPQVMEIIRKRAPYATCGYSDALARQYQQNPASLRNL